MSADPSRESLGYLVVDVGRLLRRVFDRRIAHLGLNRTQWRALARLMRTEGVTQAELAEQMEIEPIAVGRLVDRLHAAGLVERRPDPHDRRVWRLYLQPQSAQVTGQVETFAQALRKETLDGIGADELATTLWVLARVRENLLRLDDEDPDDP